VAVLVACASALRCPHGPPTCGMGALHGSVSLHVVVVESGKVHLRPAPIVALDASPALSRSHANFARWDPTLTLQEREFALSVHGAPRWMKLGRLHALLAYQATNLIV